MCAGVYNITIQKRANFAFTAKLTKENGTPYDLTNRTLRGQIRRSFDNVLQAELSIIELDAPNGIIEVSLTKEQTASLVEADSYYDIFADYDLSGDADKVLMGEVKIVRNSTEL
jgi:hypothetical protein